MAGKKRGVSDTFRRLLRGGADLVHKGDLTQALVQFKKALALARRNGNPEETNRAIASLSACYVELGQYARATKGLREIILRSRDPETICAAAYNLSISLRRQGNFPKAFVYAKKAFEKSKELSNTNWRARCHNLIGNICLVQSHLNKALKQYRMALKLRLAEKPPNEFSIGLLRDNIGYCQMLRGEYEKGIINVREALQMVTRLGSKKSICECAHDLSFGYMQVRRLDEALAYGIRALEIAEAEKYNEIIKNCYYLLGEINYLRGDEKARDHYFYRLQKMYPNMPFLRDFLCTFDVSRIIALRFPQ